MFADLKGLNDMVNQMTVVDFPLKLVGSSIGFIIDLPEDSIDRADFRNAD
eukprot:CAMPEP_0116901028 /NCGR_PEP_ID=MMETSP0467-20121206/9078_1 /TAXON_ID=283647 /ORGANISM="Mesodinium pulex, Strain SPMC105" /LENGTH=49 /DNA_ID=CAMNT_0004574401 /DNA_START=659 /DNA_END=808 /DNA_ORIENTATION=+